MSENLLVRRSTVSGLVLIKQPWSKELLEKIAVQDGQWVVRNAAAQALEVLQKPAARIPSPLSPPSETPRLLGFASKNGLGIPPGDPAQDILLDALQTGNEDEQIAALNYLREYSDEKVITAITNAAVKGEPILSEAAQLALWYVACRMPDTIKVTRTGR
jgi:HEAT repeat protein